MGEAQVLLLQKKKKKTFQISVAGETSKMHEVIANTFEFCNLFFSFFHIISFHFTFAHFFLFLRIFVVGRLKLQTHTYTCRYDLYTVTFCCILNATHKTLKFINITRKLREMHRSVCFPKTRLQDLSNTSDNFFLAI